MLIGNTVVGSSTDDGDEKKKNWMSLKQNNPPQLLQKCAGVRKAILLRK
jgi:hypothetical protein